MAPWGPVRDRPLLFLAASLLLCGSLHALTASEPPLRATPATVAALEGSRVLVVGVVAAASPQLDGSLRLLLADGQHAVWVDLPEAVPAARGSWAEIEGRVWRRGVELEVAAVAGGLVRVGVPPQPLEPGWEQLSADPSQWIRRPVRLVGSVDGDVLSGDSGASLRLGSGPWPVEGPVVAVGSLAYRAACLCYQFDAVAVDSPWKPS